VNSISTLYRPINANITLVNNLERDSPTLMFISTGNRFAYIVFLFVAQVDNCVYLNSYINANVTLVVPSTSPDPAFFGTAKTFNGPLNLIVTHEPSSPPAIYGFRALNDLGPTHVTVDSKFEGSFDVQTRFAPVVVDKGTDSGSSNNPYGGIGGRRYQYDLVSPQKVVGWTGWQPRQSSGKWVSHWRDRLANEGFLVLESSLSPVHLQLSLKV
jgi:hypothetical protein